MAALVIHWLILVDLAVFSTEISAFILVCGHVTSEVRQFLTALTFLLLMFGSSIPIFCSTVGCPDVAGNFVDMPRATVSLFAITLGWFEADDVMEMRETDLVLLLSLMLFVGMSVVLLLNLLIAQLNRSYEYIYQDMLGFARLNRASLIVEAMFNCSKLKWERFCEVLNFEEKIEFDEGDIGLAGGIQKFEPQGQVIVKDAIKRYGGSTSPDMPWPPDKASTEDVEERWDRLEGLLSKALRRLHQNTSGGSTAQETQGGSSMDQSGSFVSSMSMSSASSAA
jgi:hypothetical protein